MNAPALYSTINDLQRRDAREFSGEFVNELGKMSGRCLDIGTGPGDVTVDFILPNLDTKASLLCSDTSEEMVNFARKKYKDNHRLSFVKLNIESPVLPKDLIEQFDNVTSFYCLHWCQNIGQAFKNIFDLLQPGGTALLTFAVNTPVYDAFPDLVAMPEYQPYMKDAIGYTPVFQHSERPSETLKALIENVGFDLHHCSVREMHYSFNNPDMLSNFLLATYPFMDEMPAGLRDKYREDLVKEVTKQMITVDKKTNNKEKYSVLFIYYVFVVYFRKPLAN